MRLLFPYLSQLGLLLGALWLAGLACRAWVTTWQLGPANVSVSRTALAAGSLFVLACKWLLGSLHASVPELISPLLDLPHVLCCPAADRKLRACASKRCCLRCNDATCEHQQRRVCVECCSDDASCFMLLRPMLSCHASGLFQPKWCSCVWILRRYQSIKQFHVGPI